MQPSPLDRSRTQVLKLMDKLEPRDLGLVEDDFLVSNSLTNGVNNISYGTIRPQAYFAASECVRMCGEHRMPPSFHHPSDVSAR